MRIVVLSLLIGAAACHATPTSPSRPQHRLHTGPFFATDHRYGYSDRCPGDVEVIADGTDAGKQLLPRRIIATLDVAERSVRYPDQEPIALWLNVAGDGQYDHAEAEHVRWWSDMHGVPVIIYADGEGGVATALKLMAHATDILGFNAYPRPGELPADTLARAQQQARWPNLALVRPLYTDLGAWPVQQILDLQNPLTRWVMTDERFQYDLYFSCGRASGVLDHPEFLSEAQWIVDREAGR